MTEVTSTFQRRPAYRYIRAADRLPTYADLGDRTADDITAPVRLFNPTGIGTWYIAAYDPDTMIAWGVADIHCRELGSFSMQELLDFRGRFNLPIERDLHYRPTSLATLLGDATRA